MKLIKILLFFVVTSCFTLQSYAMLGLAEEQEGEPAAYVFPASSNQYDVATEAFGNRAGCYLVTVYSSQQLISVCDNFGNQYTSSSQDALSALTRIIEYVLDGEELFSKRFWEEHNKGTFRVIIKPGDCVLVLKATR